MQMRGGARAAFRRVGWSISLTVVSGSCRRSHYQKRCVPRWLVGALLGLCLGGVACGGNCPAISHDDFYSLDSRPDGGSSDAGPDGAVSVDASSPPDAGAPFRLNCGSLADGCTTGQPCPATCDCVLTRERMTMSPTTVIDSCILATGRAVPSVEVRSHVIVDCE